METKKEPFKDYIKKFDTETLQVMHSAYSTTKSRFFMLKHEDQKRARVIKKELKLISKI